MHSNTLHFQPFQLLSSRTLIQHVLSPVHFLYTLCKTLTRPPSSCTWKSLLHRAVCCWETPTGGWREKKQIKDLKSFLRITFISQCNVNYRQLCSNSPGFLCNYTLSLTPLLKPVPIRSIKFRGCMLCICSDLLYWVCALSWCRRPWRSERWRAAKPPPPPTRGRQRWNGDSSGCSPKTAEASWGRRKTQVRTTAAKIFF